MTVSVEQLAQRCMANAVTHEERLTSALAVATALVGNALANPWRPVPEEVSDECVLRTGYNVFKKADTTQSDSMLSADGTTLVPGVPNDPLRTSWELIKRYVNRV